MKDQAVIYRLLELAAADPPVLFSLDDGANAEDLDEAMRIITALRAEERKAKTTPVSRGR